MSQSVVAALRIRPTHVLLKSRDPELANRLGLALIRASSPAAVVLDIRPAGTVTPPDALSWRSLIPRERHFLCTAPSHQEVATGGAASASWPIARIDAPDRAISDLVSFLITPEAAVHAIRGHLPPDRPLPILIADGWRAEKLFPDDPTTTGHVLRVQKEMRLSIVMASDATNRDDSSVFDFVFDVLPMSAEGPGVRLRCRRSAPGESIRPGDELSVREFVDAAPASAESEPALATLLAPLGV
ncbi:MAG: hypothetical protein L3K07_00440 [Thermoplasmata archaeon]|nr:hypothetical protein [Thermoplasmata archaeon]